MDSPNNQINDGRNLKTLTSKQKHFISKQKSQNNTEEFLSRHPNDFSNVDVLMTLHFA